MKKILIVLAVFVIVGCGTTEELKNRETKEQNSAFRNQNSEIERLISQLGDKDWQTREKAQKELIKIGKPIIPELSKVLKSSNPEVAMRAKLILKEITQEKKPIKIIQGRIRTIVNSQKFIVISFEKNAKIKVGMELSVLSGDEKIAKIRIETVREVFSSAIIIEGSIKEIGRKYKFINSSD